MSVRCLRCGTMLREVTQFCADCGSEMPPEPGVVRAEAPTPWVEPKEVAAPPLTRCPNCGNTATPGDTFCAVCGTALDAKPRLRYAGFWIRFIARIVDGMILLVVNLLILLIFADAAMVIIFQVLSSAVYTIGFWTAAGATPGKMALGLRITTTEGGDISLGQAILRYLGEFVSALTFGIGYLMIGFTEKKQGLHDYIAGTVVIQNN